MQQQVIQSSGSTNVQELSLILALSSFCFVKSRFVFISVFGFRELVLCTMAQVIIVIDLAGNIPKW